MRGWFPAVCVIFAVFINRDVFAVFKTCLKKIPPTFILEKISKSNSIVNQELL